MQSTVPQKPSIPMRSQGGAEMSPDMTFSSYVYCTLCTKVPASVMSTPTSASLAAALSAALFPPPSSLGWPSCDE